MQTHHTPASAVVESSVPKPAVQNKSVPTQRAIKGVSHSAVSHSARHSLKSINPQGSFKPSHQGLPERLKHGIEQLSGYSMDDVTVHRNSSKPAQLSAHAFAQGNNIYLGPGQEKHLPHEAWHLVQQKQGRVKSTLQLKSGTWVNDQPELEKEADEMGAKASRYHFSLHRKSPLQRAGFNKHRAEPLVVQRARTVIVGESHGLAKIRVRRKRTILSTNPGGGWIRQSEPSKLAAALIQHNNFTPPASYQAELERQMRINGALRNVMDTAERISNGNDPKWGAEDNLIGVGSSARGTGAVAPKSARTHIENPQVRADASFIRALSALGGHTLPKNIVERGFPDKSGYQVLKLIGNRVVAEAESKLSRTSAPIQAKWASLIAPTGLLGQVVKRTPSIAVTDETGASNELVPRGNRSQWADQVIVQIEKGLQALLETVVDEIIKTLGADFNRPLQASPMSKQLIDDIAAAKYGSAASVLSRMHAIASIARTLTQLEGVSSNNERYRTQNPRVVNPRLGYIVGDSHLTDFVEIKKVHTDNDPLKSILDNATIVRQSAYGNLRRAARNAVIATGRTPTLEIT
ncbi:DUF4157 domain-containing protein [uncultured Shewanella sp.]|uniref:eCIS core domain-containing protein n=1 Tax=uncultured Shewanella sp. TaxID=173975 RepID=UPI002617BC85|nr:DUF4157 domain-containing protein [uncultured Shewanella sp.]